MQCLTCHALRSLTVWHEPQTTAMQADPPRSDVRSFCAKQANMTQARLAYWLHTPIWYCIATCKRYLTGQCDDAAAEMTTTTRATTD